MPVHCHLKMRVKNIPQNVTLFLNRAKRANCLNLFLNLKLLETEPLAFLRFIFYFKSRFIFYIFYIDFVEKNVSGLKM